MNFTGAYKRQQRNPNQMYYPMHNSVASYWTEALQKCEMQQEYDNNIFINNLHLIPDPLKKNLADTLFANESPRSPEKMTPQGQKMPLHTMNLSGVKPKEESRTTLGGIGSFFSGVFNVLTGVMFRSKSPVNYYDCFDVDGHQGSPAGWQRANSDDQDKNGQAAEKKSYDAPPNPNVSEDMNSDSRNTVTSCESKLNQVLNLLSPKQARSSPVWVRKRPKKVFVEPGSVSDSFEDAFSPEDFVNLPDSSFIEFYSPVQYHCQELYETAAQKTMLNTPVKDNTDIVKEIVNKSNLELKKEECVNTDDTQLENNKLQLVKDNVQLEKGNLNLETGSLELKNDDLNLEKEQRLENKSHSDMRNLEQNTSVKDQLVSSCEDKLSRLKALLLEKRKKNTTVSTDVVPETSQTKQTKQIPIEKRPADKRYKNPKRHTDKRRKTKLKCKIEEDLLFANEINPGSLGTPSSVENSPMQHKVNFGDYFDEVSGRFRTSSTGSNDSFQIVFNDIPKPTCIRTTSDCDSEDSFIVFEDSPESCYMSNDVFGDSDESDSDSGLSDSGCGMVTCKLAHTLTRTVSNLADDSLYVESEDEVDFANVEEPVAEQKSGLLLDDKKRLMRKNLPCKTVHFSSDPPKVHVMRVWAFAARQARAGHWERYAVDRDRFKRRIADVEVAVSWVLKPQHRSRVMFQRFMPWWNQQKRKELAEKKEKEAEEKRQEEHKLLRKQEEERRLDENILDLGSESNVENENSDMNKHQTRNRTETTDNVRDEESNHSQKEQSRREVTDKTKEFNSNKVIGEETAKNLEELDEERNGLTKKKEDAKSYGNLNVEKIS